MDKTPEFREWENSIEWDNPILWEPEPEWDEFLSGPEYHMWKLLMECEDE